MGADNWSERCLEALVGSKSRTTTTQTTGHRPLVQTYRADPWRGRARNSSRYPGYLTDAAHADSSLRQTATNRKNHHRRTNLVEQRLEMKHRSCAVSMQHHTHQTSSSNHHDVRCGTRGKLLGSNPSLSLLSPHTHLQRFAKARLTQRTEVVRGDSSSASAWTFSKVDVGVAPCEGTPTKLKRISSLGSPVEHSGTSHSQVHSCPATDDFTSTTTHFCALPKILSASADITKLCFIVLACLGLWNSCDSQFCDN